MCGKYVISGLALLGAFTLGCGEIPRRASSTPMVAPEEKTPVPERTSRDQGPRDRRDGRAADGRGGGRSRGAKARTDDTWALSSDGLRRGRDPHRRRERQVQRRRALGQSRQG